MWGKDFVEKEGLNALEKVGEKALENWGGTTTPLNQGLVSVIVDAITKHVSTGGSAPDVTLLKASIGQLIEGTVGVLQATGKITAKEAAVVEKVAAVQNLAGSGLAVGSGLDRVLSAPPKLIPPSVPQSIG